MIIATPHRGCTVVSLAPAEITEIFELRAMLEASLAKAAARKKEPNAVRRLREIASTMRSLQVSINEADQQRWFDLNYELHDILLAVAGRRHHLRVLQIVRALAEPYIRMEICLARSFAEAQDEHEGLIDAFAAGDLVDALRTEISAAHDRLAHPPLRPVRNALSCRQHCPRPPAARGITSSR
jgi:DNA-binding GntR family transcriptional regulator